MSSDDRIKTALSNLIKVGIVGTLGLTVSIVSARASLPDSISTSPQTDVALKLASIRELVGSVPASQSSGEETGPKVAQWYNWDNWGNYFNNWQKPWYNFNNWGNY